MKLDQTAANAPCGVRLAGTGSYVPEKVLSNDDLSKMMDTSDEWIVQRTGIQERRMLDPTKESHLSMTLAAMQRALEDAQMEGSELDLIIVGTVSMSMMCPSTACLISDAIGAAPAGAFDLTAACSGFLYAMNLADSLIRSGRHRKIGVVGVEALSTIVDYTDRGSAILFGDAASAAILCADENPGRGCIYQRIEADGRDWKTLYLPKKEEDFFEGDPSTNKPGTLRMQGREVYKFAVTKFQWAIKDALDFTGLSPEDVGVYICHQSNLRIIDSAIEKLGLPRENVFINIDKFGNCSSASVGLCLDQVRKAGRMPENKPVVLVAFGGGLTWASSVWIP
jgi:3-oxoacyl-[acyl-carrier-protein] synthase-3